jgi:hypothetical protein
LAVVTRRQALGEGLEKVPGILTSTYSQIGTIYSDLNRYNLVFTEIDFAALKVMNDCQLVHNDNILTALSESKFELSTSF